MNNTIKTERLILRPLTLSDAETAYYGWTGDADVARYVSWLPHHSIEDTVLWLKEIAWKREGAGNISDNYIWGFVLRETGELFGSGGLIWEESNKLYQVGYNIMKSHWNNGYTTEAMRAILRYAAKNLGIKRVAGGHAKENLASAKVIEKLGFVYDRDDSTPHVDGIRHFDSREYYLDLEPENKRNANVRVMRETDYECLTEFLYQAVYIPQGTDPPPRSILDDPQIIVYIKDFGTQPGDLGVVAQLNGQVVGAAWTRVIPAYGHIDSETPELAISMLPEFRGYGIGTKLMKKLFDVLRENGYKRTSLSVQKDNPAVRLYQRLGYKLTGERIDHAGHEDYLMVKELCGMTNDVLQTIKKRRSVRAFEPEQIGGEELAAIVEAGQHAPNGGGEAWHFTVIQNEEILDKLSRLAKLYAATCGLPWLEKLGRDDSFHSVYHAPAVILVSADEQSPCAESDSAAATQNLLLAAESLGIGSCWGYFVTQAFLTDEGKSMREKLGIPDGYKVYSSVMLGYRAGEALPTPERKPDSVTYIK